MTGRSAKSAVAVAVATVTAGLAGLALAGFLVLLRMPEPVGAAAHASRRFGLVALGFGCVGAALGGVVGVVVGVGHWSTAVLAMVEAGVLGLVLASAVGVLVGAVVGGADYCSRTHAA